MNHSQSLDYLPLDQYQQIICQWNKTDKEYPDKKTIQRLFEEQVERTPDRVALVYEDNSLTYKELNNRANKLANYLKDRYQINPDTLIALALNRSEQMLIAILAVLKSGAAYVPIDTSYPDERIIYILKDTSVKVVITNSIYEERLKQIDAHNEIDYKNQDPENEAKKTRINIVSIDSKTLQEQLALESISNPETETLSTNLAYVIYTSGTTGKPKGVMVQHTGVINRIAWMNNTYPLNEKDKILHKTPYVFDVSLWELFWANWYGASIIIAKPESHKDSNYLISLIYTKSITIVHFVPSMLRIFQDTLSQIIEKPKYNTGIFFNLRYLFCSGEALNIKDVTKHHIILPGTEIHNLYGPTEASIDALYFNCTDKKISEIYIGRPIDNTFAYVLDICLNPLPIGKIGELYIGGIGLARGYLNKPDLTAEKFIANPFYNEKEEVKNTNKRLYKTGDLVKWKHDGNLEYIGRNDTQIKINGHRIELGEIENVLLAYEDVNQCVVLAKERIDEKEQYIENKFLVAYYLKNSNKTESFQKGFLDNWKTIYQSQYELLDISSFKENFISWNSSYTGKALSQEDMLEWKNNIIEKIKQLKPKVILEVGTGSGLILFNIIDSCNYYFATDFSKNAINYINKVVDQHNYIDKVFSIVCDADKLPYHKIDKSYDTVIINSVSQYFPNANYLESLITNLILNMNDCGQIFIGDIRDLTLLKCFHHSVLSYKTNLVTKNEIEYLSKKDKELLISPVFFLYLQSNNQFISKIEIQPKIGEIDNEMNKYRYDVILYINKAKERTNSEEEILTVNKGSFEKVINLQEYLNAHQDSNNFLCIRYPNKRIIKDYLNFSKIFDDYQIDSSMSENYYSIFSIIEILALIETAQLNIKFYIDIGSPLYLNLVIYKGPIKKIYLRYTDNINSLTCELTNNPLYESKLIEAEFANELRKHLVNRLPGYMIPAYYVAVSKWPLTINGKLDKNSLPTPQYYLIENYCPPKTALENKLCQIISEVLGIDKNKISTQDDFFILGADSIIIIRIISKLRQNLELNINMQDIFQYKTIEKLSNYIISKPQNNAPIIQKNTEQGVLTGEFELLPIQEWFFANSFHRITHSWVHSFAIRTPILNITKLKESIAKLIMYHDSLRLRFLEKDTSLENVINGNVASSSSCKYFQRYENANETMDLEILDVSSIKVKEGTVKFQEELQKILSNWHSKINIKQGPLFIVGYIYGFVDGSSRVYFGLHHLVVDTVSWRILTEDLRDIYNEKNLGFKKSSYRQWVNAVEEYATTHENEKNYWASYKANKSILSKLVNEAFTYNTGFSLTEQQTKALLHESNKTFNTKINDLLLTALGHALFVVTESKTNHILLEGHGREEINPSIDISRTVGWFTTMYPITLRVSDKLADSIKIVKDTLSQIPNKGIGYGELIGYDTKLPIITFNYLGQFNNENIHHYWSITDEYLHVSMNPPYHSYNAVIINGWTIDDKIFFSVKSKLDKEVTDKLTNAFEYYLKCIINYTISQERSYLTSSDVGNIISQEYLDKLQLDKEIEGVYLANSLQQGFIYHKLKQGEIDDAYIVQLIWQYNSSLDSNKLREAWECAQKKYASLRIRFAWEEELVQIIDKEGILKWNYIDISKELDTDVQKSKIKQIQEKDRLEPYQLEKNSLFRIYLIKQKENLYSCVFSNHHAILDGWSCQELITYVHDIYLKLAASEPVSIIMDHSYEASQKYIQKNQEENKEYWAGYVNQIEDRLDLRGLLKDTKRQVKIHGYKHIKQAEKELIKVEGKLYYQLKELIQNEGVTFNAILQYVWHKLLSLYGNTKQTVVGTTVSGRNMPINNIEKSVGLYINTLPLIVEHRDDDKVIDCIKRIQGNINEINSKSYIILAKLQKEGGRLFDSLFVYENYPKSTEEAESNALGIEFRSSIEKTDYPLGITVYEKNELLTLKLDYAGELFAKETVKYLLEVTRTLLSEVASKYKQKVSELKYLSEERYKQILEEWNKTAKDYPDNKTIQHLFEEQVERTPAATALVYEDNILSYKELNDRANKLANYLKNRYAIKPDTLITLALKRNEQLLIAILAVLKSGGAYVPIDIDYPDERISYILKDAGSKVVITNSIYEERLRLIAKNNGIEYKSQDSENEEGFRVNIVAIDNQNLQEQLALESASNPKTEALSTNLAYVIYTSGTTGKPKGVMVEHKGVINLVAAQSVAFGLLNPEHKYAKNCLLYANYVFDAHVSELYTAILNGHVIHLINNNLRQDIKLLKYYIESNNINVATIPPILLSDKEDLLKLELLIVAGEKPRQEILDYYFNNNIKIINAYGPSEVTVCISLKNYNNNNAANIGLPISNIKCYVLTDNLTPVPINAIGELYVGGVGVARGYLNKPALTAEKFIANPFYCEEEGSKRRNSRLYKTGDLVRWLPNGSLEYIGRSDLQVKIRGHRIELGEIESLLSSYEGVIQSIVVVRERANLVTKYLVGYYVSNTKLIDEKLIEYLQEKLPEYMVPSRLVRIEKIPLTLNGKVDYSKLQREEFVDESSYIAPRNELENKIRKVWSEVLGISEEQVGIKDNFFQLGGNSILIIKLKAKLEKTLDFKDIEISSLFKYHTINKLSSYILNKEQTIADHKINYQKNLTIDEQDIAVISMSGAFSGAENIENYWDNIINGRESLTTLSKELCRENSVAESMLNDPGFIPTSGIIENIDKFDYNFWKLSFKDAVLLDPQIRKFLEHSWIALEKAGYIKDREKKKISVFVGASDSKYCHIRAQGISMKSSPQSSWEYQMMNGKDFLAMHLSYLLGLTGTSITINTACSTSLVAIAEACKSLSLGECDIALAGGVSLIIPESHGYIYNEGMIYSKDGHCKVFDQDSSGTVSGSGIGVVILKKLKEAIIDKDNIIAVIKGYATNNDGNRKVGFTAPSVIGQTECILSALRKAKVTADTISYVECHGTGTNLGDPIEIKALGDAFKASSIKNQFECVIGAVKANIGHADAAAGVSGFIKVCKMLQTKIIPPQINLVTPNPNLNLDSTNFKILTDKQNWNAEYPRRAGVSSFGIGGTNAHIVLEEYQASEEVKLDDILPPYTILPISAKSENSLVKYCSVLADHLNCIPNVDLTSISYTLCSKREDFNYRRAIIFKDKNEAISELRGKLTPTIIDQLESDIIFMFPGQGTQYVNMAKSLYQNQPVFRKYIDKGCKILDEITKVDFKEYLYPTNNYNKNLLKDTKWAQPALFLICFSLAKLLEDLNLKAACYIGHSIGEYVAATLSGVFTFEDALRVVAKRSELIQQMPKGRMIAINIPAEQISDLLPDTLEIAAYNAPDYLVVSGPYEEIQSFTLILEKKEIPYKELHTTHAFHSRMMKNAAESFCLFLQTINIKKPNSKFISNITGEFIDDNQATSSNYWADHIMKPVRFNQGINTLANKYKKAIFLEIGPGQTLSTFVNLYRNVNKAPSINVVNLLVGAKESHLNPDEGDKQFYKGMAQLWNLGSEVNLEKILGVDSRSIKISELPAYQFDKHICWEKLSKEKLQDKIQSNSNEMDIIISNTSKYLIEKDATELENTIASVFCGILGNSIISKFDNYFELGGNSLSAINLIKKLNKQLNTSLAIPIIFKHTTINKLAEYIEEIKQNITHSIGAIDEGEL